METQQIDSGNTKQLSAIERALAAAKARKAMKAANGEADAPVVTKSSAPKEPKPKEPKPTDEVREAARQQRDVERVERLNAKAEKMKAEAEAKAAKKAEREAAKAARKAAKDAEKTDKKPAHMKKVERARSKCPALNSAAEALYGEITVNLSAHQIDALAQHLLVHVRETRTLRATQTSQLPMGATVRITGGEPKYIGMVGTVVHSQKLRAKVAVDGITKPVYIYTGEAEVFLQQTVAVAS